MACKLFIRMRMREVVIEKQIQWVLSYVQEGSVDIWKENVLEDLEAESLEYETVEEFLTDLKKEFGGENNKTIKVTELKRIEQGSRVIEEFVQEFRRVAKGSGYERRPLVEKFKREISGTRRRKLIWQKDLLEVLSSDIRGQSI